MGCGRGPRIPGQKFLTNEGTRSSYVTSPRKFKWANQDEAAKAGSARPITWQCPRKQGYKGTSTGLLSFTLFEDSSVHTLCFFIVSIL